jgi:hypothetical protein
MDAAGGYALAYDAARKALIAVLENQGLRPTTRGATSRCTRRSVLSSTRQWARSCAPFDRMPRQHNDAEYSPTDAPQMTAADVREDLEKASAIIDLVAGVLDRMSPF